MKYYIIYQITNTINGKIYIGAHETSNLNDGYMGSGTQISRAIRKYGLEKFTKEILFLCENAEKMYLKESEIVNSDFLSRSDVYNIKKGGIGGWDHINNGSEEHINRCKRAGDIASSTGKTKNNKFPTHASFKGGKTSAEKTRNTTRFSGVKEKISTTLTGKTLGHRWYNNGINNKKIKNGDIIPEGYLQGMINNQKKNSV